MSKLPIMLNSVPSRMLYFIVYDYCNKQSHFANSFVLLKNQTNCEVLCLNEYFCVNIFLRNYLYFILYKMLNIWTHPINVVKPTISIVLVKPTTKQWLFHANTDHIQDYSITTVSLKLVKYKHVKMYTSFAWKNHKILQVIF